MTGSDAAGLAMGVYDTHTLPIYAYLHSPRHPRYAILDNFFQAAFGGSFLNHQWLIAAATPISWHAANDGSSNDYHSVVDGWGMPSNYPLYASPLGDAVVDGALTASCDPPVGRPPTPTGVVCGDYAVNTMQPESQPRGGHGPVLAPQTAPTIGDELSEAGIAWAWYSGGWSNAAGAVGAPGWTIGSGPACSDPGTRPGAQFPNCPNNVFQYHHQPFNYYRNYAVGMPGRVHLRDEQEFTQLAGSSTRSCHLKAVSFVKPLGQENEHPATPASIMVATISSRFSGRSRVAPVPKTPW